MENCLIQSVFITAGIMVFVIGMNSILIPNELLGAGVSGVAIIHYLFPSANAGTQKEVIFTITTPTELPKLKTVIFNIDPEAFVVVNSTLEVTGKRHGTQKVY